MSERRKVVLLLETSRGFGRGLLRGIIRWTQIRDSYLLIGSTGHFEKDVPKLQAHEKAGIIATLSSVKQCKILKEMNLPTIVVEPAFHHLMEIYHDMNVSTITVNETGVSKMIADHFLKNGFENFAFCGIPNNTSWSLAREKAFQQYLREKGIECHIFPSVYKPKNPFHWRQDSKYLARWLHSLPEHTALMACNDDRGRHILEVCQQEEIPVPQKISVIGVDDDDLVCDLTTPSLSSVALDVQSAGFHTMAHMSDLMNARVPGNKTIYVEPLFITERRSSDFYAFDDDLILKAIRFIKENFLYPITVSDVVRACDVSRRTMERRFQDRVGVSIHEEINNRRFERAKQLLLNTQYHVSRIVILSGFSNLQQILRTFHEKIQCTPTEFRSNNLPYNL